MTTWDEAISNAIKAATEADAAKRDIYLDQRTAMVNLAVARSLAWVRIANAIHCRENGMVPDDIA